MFKRGDCEIGDEICELLVQFDWPEVLDAEIEVRVDPVTLFTMRGAGATRHELLMKAFGYYHEHVE